jgi:hypothetical protein
MGQALGERCNHGKPALCRPESHRTGVTRSRRKEEPEKRQLARPLVVRGDSLDGLDGGVSLLL